MTSVYTLLDLCVDLLFNRDLKYVVIDPEFNSEYMPLIKTLQGDKRLTKHVVMDKAISITQYPDRESYVVCDLQSPYINVNKQ